MKKATIKKPGAKKPAAKKKRGCKNGDSGKKDIPFENRRGALNPGEDKEAP